MSKVELFLPEVGCRRVNLTVLENSIAYTTTVNLIIFLFLFLCIAAVLGSRTLFIGENLHINKEYECGADLLNQNFTAHQFFNYFKVLFIFLIFEVEIIFLFIVLLSGLKLNLICIFLSILLVAVFQVSFFIETYGGILTHKR
jgi:NADH:ubiquinone oxidoreductase subunit 3 (subunit A)